MDSMCIENRNSEESSDKYLFEKLGHGFKNDRALRGLLCPLLLAFSLAPQADVVMEDTPQLFQNRFFTLSQDNNLVCATSEERYKSVAELYTIIDYYEGKNPDIRELAVSVLTDHSNAERLKELDRHKRYCRRKPYPGLCILERYWADKDAALRVLALFYDTKTIIKHSENPAHRPFTADHVRAFEKAIQKIPPFLRESISRAKPTKDLEQEILKLPERLQPLANAAYPKDFATSIWIDQTHPLMLVPGVGFGEETVAQVFSGQNLIVFTVKALDKGKDGNMYRDINLKYLVDFRLPIIIHEIAHTIDNFHFWNGKEDLYFFYKYHKLSNDSKTLPVLKDAKLALWPSKWFEAFEYLWEVNDGRYDGRTSEKLAELVAQYILIPERLQESAPEAYAWLWKHLFKEIEYQGYDSCSFAVTRPLGVWETAIAKLLGK